MLQQTGGINWETRKQMDLKKIDLGLTELLFEIL